MSVARFRRRSARPFVLGHRGVRGPKPENTLAAFEQAAAEGADGVELDVRLCGSHEVIVLHDRTLARVTADRDTRDVERVSFNELARVDLGQAQGVPALEDVLGWCRARGLFVNVELKHDVGSRLRLVRRVLNVLNARADAADFALLSSFDPTIVRALSSLAPSFVSAWLIHARQRLLRHGVGLRLLGARALHPERVIATEARIARWQRRGALVNVWTVNDPDEARRLANWGVDAIISDCPGRILGALGRG
jgi:glycerophosphoryl diester phosphodiesterase